MEEELPMFDKSDKAFPAKQNSLFLAHCAVSPLQHGAKEAACRFLNTMAEEGIRGLPSFHSLLPRFHKKCGTLLRSSAENISSVHNTAEGMCLLANGYPFSAGDEIISYIHEFPSNHYPWRLQEQRGVKLILLGDSDPHGEFADISAPRGWSMTELAAAVTAKTRIIALSHVQFTSGYAADLEELGTFCNERNIDLIIDAAQSMGCLPLYPEEYHIAAVAASTWKWLMGPVGAGILYTSPALREKVRITMAGPSCMRQGVDYLNHNWTPHTDGRKFEYSTLAWEQLAALNGLLDDVFLRYSMESIRDEIFALQDVFLSCLDPDLFRALEFAGEHRSGILSLWPAGDARDLVQKLGERGIVVTERSGYIRVAPHFYLEKKDMEKAAEWFNREAKKQ